MADETTVTGHTADGSPTTDKAAMAMAEAVFTGDDGTEQYALLIPGSGAARSEPAE